MLYFLKAVCLFVYMYIFSFPLQDVAEFQVLVPLITDVNHEF